MHENRGRVPRFSCFRGESFRTGTFRTSVFCEVKTKIIGKTKFFDSLNSFFTLSISSASPWRVFRARDLHLRHTDDAADLLLRQITRIAQTEHCLSRSGKKSCSASCSDRCEQVLSSIPRHRPDHLRVRRRTAPARAGPQPVRLLAGRYFLTTVNPAACANSDTVGDRPFRPLPSRFCRRRTPNRAFASRPADLDRTVVPQKPPNLTPILGAA